MRQDVFAVSAVVGEHLLDVSGVAGGRRALRELPVGVPIGDGEGCCFGGEVAGYWFRHGDLLW